VTALANVRWEAVFPLILACLVSVVVGLVPWIWVVWMLGLLGFLVIVGDIA
jgi:hypothetical protein